MLQLALIFGGRSAEHEISLASARFVADMLDRERYEVVPVGITRGGQWVLPRDLDAALRDGLDAAPCDPVHLVADPARPGLAAAGGPFRPLDFAFPIMHGTFAEDGTVQGLLELAGLPYAGAGVAASAVGMDKELMKDVFVARGLAQVDHVVLRDGAATGAAGVAAVEERLAYPVFVKPAKLGPALELAAAYDRKVIVEAACDGRELECSVLGNEEPRASVAGEVIPANEFYDYESKYTEGMMSFVIPADVGEAAQAAAQALAVEAYRAVDCCGYARCDLFLERSTGRLLINEINTIPGMTAMSGFPRLWAASGIGERELVEEIVRLGLERHSARSRLRTTH
jgi:D-alanine-D-alanine ligase